MQKDLCDDYIIGTRDFYHKTLYTWINFQMKVLHKWKTR